MKVVSCLGSSVMGLLTIVRKQKLRDKNLRVLVLGLDNAGKTTVVKSLLGQDTSLVSPTMGFQISSHRVEDYTLDIWDVGGQRSLRPFWQNYFDKTDCLVWVLDASTLESRGEDVKSELRQVLNSTLQGCSLVVFINKTDLQPDADFELDLEAHAVKVVKVCALQDEQEIKDTFTWIVQEARERMGVV